MKNNDLAKAIQKAKNAIKKGVSDEKNTLHKTSI